MKEGRKHALSLIKRMGSQYQREERERIERKNEEEDRIIERERMFNHMNRGRDYG